MLEDTELPQATHANVGLEAKTILRKFSRHYNKKPKNLKKEYIRVKVIRGHKRAIRQIQCEKVPRKTLHGFDPNNTVAEAAWNKLVRVYHEDWEVLDTVSRTETGPLTDGKTKRRPSCKSSDTGVAKSFNNQFCADYFAPKEVRKSFFYYIEVLFITKDPETLCKKFDISCCNSAHHTLECEIKWLSLKYFFNNLMMNELDLTPWFPPSLPVNPFILHKPVPQTTSERPEQLTIGTQTTN